MKPTLLPLLALVPLAAAGCGADDGSTPADAGGHDAADDHDADGHDHDGHDDAAEGDDHEHDEAPLGAAKVGELEVELAQGHGPLVAGEEAHLVVKLPYSDDGATAVRAWIGTEDRTRSYVGKGEYAPSHDDYDVHATAPDPLPADARWWIEVERPDGTRATGSAVPILE